MDQRGKSLREQSGQGGGASTRENGGGDNPLPLPGIFTKIRAKLVPFVLMADDVLVILALPEAHPRRAPDGVDALGGGGFEPGDE